MPSFKLIASGLVASLAASVTALPASHEIVFAQPTLPASTLPQPDSSWSLKYVALGLGTQNYTCASGAPVATGAKANLYDMTTLVSIKATSKTTITMTPCQADKNNNNFKLKQLGVHYFTANGVPTFDLSEGTKNASNPQGYFLSAKKVAVATAPSDACSGRDGQPAVPWLQLLDDGLGTTRGFKGVYRVETSGGSAPSNCTGKTGEFVQDYAAEYWFYG